MAIFLEGEIRGGDRNRPRVFITGGSDLYKGKTLDCTAGNDLSGVRKVAVVVSGMIKTAYSQIAGLKPSDVRYRERTRKKPRVKPKPVGASLKVLFTKTVSPISSANSTYTWYIGGDRISPKLIYFDDHNSAGGINPYYHRSFNNTGFGDKYIGFLDREGTYPYSGIPGINHKRLMYSDGNSASIVYDNPRGISSGGGSSNEYEEYQFYLRSPVLYPSFNYQFIYIDYRYSYDSSYGSPVQYDFARIDRFSYDIYNKALLDTSYVMNSSSSGNVVPNERSDKTDVVIVPNQFMVTPPNPNGGYDEVFSLHRQNDKGNQSFGLYTNYTNSALNEYRWYKFDGTNLTYKSLSVADYNASTNTYKLFDWRDVNWIGDKIYVSDAWINDTSDEFYSLGRYRGDVAKYDNKTDVIVRVYEFKLDPLNSDKFVIEQTDAFVFPVERLTPADFDGTIPPDTSTGDPITFYSPVALSYHPG